MSLLEKCIVGSLLIKFPQGYEPACLNAAVTYNFPEILQEQPAGMHISELSRKSGIEERKAGRILRLLASKHIFREGFCLLHSIHNLQNR